MTVSELTQSVLDAAIDATHTSEKLEYKTDTSRPQVSKPQVQISNSRQGTHSIPTKALSQPFRPTQSNKDPPQTSPPAANQLQRTPSGGRLARGMLVLDNEFNIEEWEAERQELEQQMERTRQSTTNQGTSANHTVRVASTSNRGNSNSMRQHGSACAASATKNGSFGPGPGPPIPKQQQQQQQQQQRRRRQQHSVPEIWTGAGNIAATAIGTGNHSALIATVGAKSPQGQSPLPPRSLRAPPLPPPPELMPSAMPKAVGRLPPLERCNSTPTAHLKPDTSPKVSPTLEVFQRQRAPGSVRNDSSCDLPPVQSPSRTRDSKLTQARTRAVFFPGETANSMCRERRSSSTPALRNEPQDAHGMLQAQLDKIELLKGRVGHMSLA